MPALPLPSRSADEVRLADWLELLALQAADKNASVGDLEGALRRATIFHRNSNTSIENKCAEVVWELHQRAKSADHAYPFEIEGSLLNLRDDPQDFIAYIFCLCLSYFGWENKRGRKIFPDRLFEELSCLAAQKFTGGEAVKFGYPRQVLPKKFAKAADKLCQLLGECSGFKEQPANSAKDDGLDIVAWRNFPDELSSKLILFGQCATGLQSRKKQKEKELQPKEFCENWFLETPISPVLKAFFTPDQAEPRNRKHFGRKAGIIFDRCRIAYLTHGTAGLSKGNPYFEWATSVLNKVDM